MHFVKNLFWNAGQSRIRTGYRVVILLFLYILLRNVFETTFRQLEPQIRLNDKIPAGVIPVFGLIRFLPALITVWLAGRFLDRRSFSEFGFHIDKRWRRDFFFGLALGAVLMTLIFLIEYFLGWAAVQNVFYVSKAENGFILPFVMLLIFFLFAAGAEELVMRGYVIKNLAEGFSFRSLGPKWGLAIAYVFSSVLFGLFHLENPDATFISTFNIIVGGLLLGLGFILTGELAIPLGIHISWNFFQGNVFGFPVSGVTFPRDILSVIRIKQSGPELWTGGDFGPEAGLAGLIAMILGIILTLFYVRFYKNGGKAQIHSGESISERSSEAVSAE